MTRRRARLLTSCGICALGCVLVAFGAGVTFNFAPLNVIGYILAIMGAFGMLGVNIFWGGQLDQRLDHDPGLSPVAREELETRVNKQGAAGRKLARILLAIPPIGAAIVLALVLLGVL